MEFCSIWLSWPSLSGQSSSIEDWKLAVIRSNAALLSAGDVYTIISDDDDIIDLLGVDAPFNFVDAASISLAVSHWLSMGTGMDPRTPLRVYCPVVNQATDLMRLWLGLTRPGLVYLDTDMRLLRIPDFVGRDGGAWFSKSGDPARPYLSLFYSGWSTRLFVCLLDLVASDILSGSWPWFAMGFDAAFNRLVKRWPESDYHHHHRGAGRMHIPRQFFQGASCQRQGE